MKAAQLGERLKDLFTRMIAHNMRASKHDHLSMRLNFPLIGRDEGSKVEVTNADIDAVLAAEDVERSRE